MIRIFVLLLLLMTPAVLAKVKVVTATSDLAWFTEQIGGDQVDVDAIASPTADIHFVEVRPSYMVKVSRADIVFRVGLELDMWLDKIIDGSRNNNLEIVDCSKYIKPLEVPTFKADARYGDLHRFGNPHYWLSPDNIEPITRAIVEGLSSVDPANSQMYQAKREQLLTNIQSQIEALQPKIERLRGVKAIYYHNSWPYFDNYVGMEAVDFIEPYPGVSPSPTHIKELTDLVQGHSITVIGVEPYFDRRVPEKIAGSTEAKVVTLYPSIGGRSKDEGYIEWFEGNLDALLEVLP